MGNIAKQCRLGLFQDSDFAGDLEDSKSTCGGTLCVFGSHTFVSISWMCKKQTSVSHSFNRIRNHFLWMQDWVWMVFPHLIWWDLVVAVLGNTNQNHDSTGRPVNEQTWSSFTTSHKSKTQAIFENDQWFGYCWFDSLKRQIFSSGSFVVCVLKTTNQWSRWSLREEARQWDLFPGPIESPLIGYSIESFWTPKSKSSTLIPSTNSQTYWQFHTWRMESSSVFVQH